MKIDGPSTRSETALAEQRYRFLLTASTMLSAAMDSGAAIEVLGRAAVPALAELALVDMVEPDGRLARVGSRASDLEFAASMERVSPVSGTPHPAIRVVQTGEPVLIPEATDYELQVIAGNEENFAVLRERNLRWCLSVPIVARSCLGALTLVAEDGSYGNDLTVVPAMAEDLARRAALALDNAKMFESSRDMAVTLQKSLLPAALPEIPGLDIAARYNAGGEGAEVGGDFYDVFQPGSPDEGWSAVIGDVCGKGAEAAALSALARHTIRAANVNLRKPRRILAFLNQLVLQSGYAERFITVAYCRMRRAPGGIHVTLGRAGHPPPLLLDREGRGSPKGRPGTLIGVTPEPNLADQLFAMYPGETLVLYTDGVTEARGQEGRFGQRRLETELAQCAGM
ncbi:MAG TPA: PP2C family protein-serine/threonine phosphatase, partial [Actinomycetota bacterium]|nr:PP2C family protein-serine/threonine phosphatase [Actinomycetota bacterium]